MLSPNSCVKYFKVGSATRRHSVIGCIGYENANPNLTNLIITNVPEMADVGVGTSDADAEQGNGNNGNNGNKGNNGNNITCAICLECINSGSSSGSSSSDHQKKNIATTDCGHTFCLSCLLTNLHTSNLCPLCRAPIEKNVKHVLKPLSYSDGIGLLDHELNGLRIMDDVEQFVQNAIEISSQPNTDGQNVEEIVGDLMNMVTNFGFNLLYDAALHSSGSEQNMDQEWIIQMYDDVNSDNSGTTNDNNSDSDSESESDSESNDGGDTGSDDGDDADSDDEDQDDDSKSESESNENKKIMLPEVPESMLY